MIGLIICAVWLMIAVRSLALLACVAIRAGRRWTWRTLLAMSDEPSPMPAGRVQLGNYSDVRGRRMDRGRVG
jgi:hypothetical protein